MMELLEGYDDFAICPDCADPLLYDDGSNNHHCIPLFGKNNQADNQSMNQADNQNNQADNQSMNQADNQNNQADNQPTLQTSEPTIYPNQPTLQTSEPYQPTNYPNEQTSSINQLSQLLDLVRL